MARNIQSVGQATLMTVVKNSHGGFGGKDSILLKNYVQCIVGYNKGYNLPQSEHYEIVIWDNKDIAHFVPKSISVPSHCTSPHIGTTEDCDIDVEG
jgi:hypothetical protein